MKKLIFGYLFFTMIAPEFVNGAAVPEGVARETFERFVIEQCFASQLPDTEQIIRIDRNWQLGNLYLYPAQDAISAIVRNGAEGSVIGRVTYREGSEGFRDRLDFILYSKVESKWLSGTYMRTNCILTR